MALALGSGGARGYAHIGAIEVLEERGCEIVSVAGSSMGAVVGGLHAAGSLPVYADWTRTLTQRDVLRLLDPSFRAPGAFRGEKILARVGELLGDVLIEDLPIPYTAVATDLLSRREVWFQRGPVVTAIRASIALPGVFTPVMVNGRLLADGGLLNPVPVAPATSAAADLTVAVSLGGRRQGDPGTVAPVQESGALRPAEEWLERWLPAALRMPGSGAFGEDARAGQPEDAVNALPPGLRTFDVMTLAIEAMESVLTRYRLAGYPPDVLVTVPQDACRTMDFHRAEEMIALGRILMADALDEAGIHPAVGPAVG